ncbi:hypothetical protein INT47_010617 [Mucor saturninus]|uniref:Uncharacterized protein n=1 Tax=Mucor saturninus TaxID=64648 RepID=A0A8H7QVR7_9FUNG|nr:hypothetical protein INT47_010617 [Mucor saturninus]
MISYLSILLLFLSLVSGQQTNPPPTTPDGFKTDDNNSGPAEESWLKKNDRYVFVIVVSILFLAIIIWYVTRSIRGMRQRLAQENQNHMMMIGGSSNFSETVPVDNNGFHKMPDYPVSQQQQQQQQHTHRY